MWMNSMSHQSGITTTGGCFKVVDITGKKSLVIGSF